MCHFDDSSADRCGIFSRYSALGYRMCKRMFFHVLIKRLHFIKLLLFLVTYGNKLLRRNLLLLQNYNVIVFVIYIINYIIIDILQVYLLKFKRQVSQRCSYFYIHKGRLVINWVILLIVLTIKKQTVFIVEHKSPRSVDCVLRQGEGVVLFEITYTYELLFVYVKVKIQ